MLAKELFAFLHVVMLLLNLMPELAINTDTILAAFGSGNNIQISHGVCLDAAFSQIRAG